MFGYWNYYNEDFKWDDPNKLLFPDYDYTIDVLQKNGVSKDDAEKLFNSGYICFKGINILFDRFYGGLINSIDFRTRFRIEDAKELLKESPCLSATVQKVKSLDELKSVIESCEKYGRKLVFRGQNENFFITREINNPFLTIKDFGEVSLLPSIWRKMYQKNPHSYTEFTSLTLFEWSKIFYSAFDLDEIEKRHIALNNSGELLLSMSDMEDCSDELLREFGKHRLDLSMGMKFNLSEILTTLLQHYGLLSPFLDLTESLDVALFFATHKYEKVDSVSNYRFVGSNEKKSVIYIISHDKNEMRRHDENSEFLKYLNPQRPIRQKCVICTSNEYSLNLPVYFLQKILILDFDINENISGITPNQLFPDKDTDRFLKALSDNLLFKNHIAAFD